MPAEEVHNHSPAHTGKNWPCVFLYVGSSTGGYEGGEGVHVRLHGQLGKSQQHPGKDVNDDLPWSMLAQVHPS